MFTDLRLHFVKMPVVFKLTYRSDAVLIKFIASYFVKTVQMILKFVEKGKKSRIFKRILKKRNIFYICVLHDQGLLYAYNNQNSVVLVKRKLWWSIEQIRQFRNRTTHIWSVVFHKDARQFNGRKIIFLINGARTIG